MMLSCCGLCALLRSQSPWPMFNCKRKTTQSNWKSLSRTLVTALNFVNSRDIRDWQAKIVQTVHDFPTFCGLLVLFVYKIISMSGSGQLALSFVLFHTQSARLELKLSGSPRKRAFVMSPCAETSAQTKLINYTTDFYFFLRFTF